MKKKQVLIYYSGSLGDILALVPVFGAIRNAHPEDFITLLNIQDGGKSFVPGKILLQGGFIDKITVIHHKKIKLLRALRFLLCFIRSFLPHYAVIYYCGRDGRGLDKRIKRDRKLLKALAPHAVIRGDVQLQRFDDPRAVMPLVGELLLERLNAAPGEKRLQAAPNDIHLTAAEKEAARKVFDSFHIPENRIPLAVGMGGKKPVCRYPFENYRKVLNSAVEKLNCYPVFFGGAGDAEEISAMIEKLSPRCCGRADHTSLSLRETIALLAHFSAYIGNDTGTLHMAAAAGLPCVAVCSSHDNPGLWKPLGEQHVILRRDSECTGCRKNICPKQMPPPCLTSISPDTVSAALENLIKKSK